MRFWGPSRFKRLPPGFMSPWDFPRWHPRWPYIGIEAVPNPFQDLGEGGLAPASVPAEPPPTPPEPSPFRTALERWREGARVREHDRRAIENWRKLRGLGEPTPATSVTAVTTTAPPPMRTALARCIAPYGCALYGTPDVVPFGRVVTVLGGDSTWSIVTLNDPTIGWTGGWLPSRLLQPLQTFAPAAPAGPLGAGTGALAGIRGIGQEQTTSWDPNRFPSSTRGVLQTCDGFFKERGYQELVDGATADPFDGTLPRVLAWAARVMKDNLCGDQADFLLRLRDHVIQRQASGTGEPTGPTGIGPLLRSPPVPIGPENAEWEPPFEFEPYPPEEIPESAMAASFMQTSTPGSARVLRATTLRDQPDGSTIGTLPTGARVQVLSKHGAWWQVQTSAGQTGYVRAYGLNGFPLLDETPEGVSTYVPQRGGPASAAAAIRAAIIPGVF